MIKNILVLCFLCVFFSGPAFCQEEIEIDSQVISINPDSGYIIIKAGEVNGVEIGDGLIVHRDGEKIAEAQIVETRQEVTAAEILNASSEIKEGDGVLIVKKTKKPIALKKEKIYKKPVLKKEKIRQEPKKSKWATLLGSRAKISSAAPVMAVDSTLGSNNIQVGQESSVVKAIIATDTSTVFSYALMVLRENGYSVVFSSRATGAILAVKPIELSLMKELWADATARIEHKLVVSLEIKNNDGTSELSASGFKEHTQKGKQIKFPVTKDSVYSGNNNSEYYNDIVDLVSKIKERAVER